MHVFMGKIITISDEAYNELKKIKNGMSFTEIIITLVKKEKSSDLARHAGMLNNKDATSMINEIKKERKKVSRRMKDGLFR